MLRPSRFNFPISLRLDAMVAASLHCHVAIGGVAVADHQSLLSGAHSAKAGSNRRVGLQL